MVNERLEHWAMSAAARVEHTLREVEAGVYTEPLMHLATVYGVLSVAYYREDSPLVSDGAFDALCMYLLEHFDEAIEQGTSPHILRKGMLEAGTGYHFNTHDRLPGYAGSVADVYTCLVLARRGYVVWADDPSNPVRRGTSTRSRPVVLEAPVRTRARPVPTVDVPVRTRTRAPVVVDVPVRTRTRTRG